MQRIPPVIAEVLSRLAVPCSDTQPLAVNDYLLYSDLSYASRLIRCEGNSWDISFVTHITIYKLHSLHDQDCLLYFVLRIC